MVPSRGLFTTTIGAVDDNDDSALVMLLAVTVENAEEEPTESPARAAVEVRENSCGGIGVVGL